MVDGRSVQSGSGDEALSRRRFLGVLPVLGLPVLAPDGAARSGPSRGGSSSELSRTPFEYPRHDLERVQAVVGASHGAFDRVRALVTEQPALAKASWDWGFGDWETPLGAASHTGRREIADFLLAHGARPTIFSAAMMGDLPTVEAFLTRDPALFELHGPHGISLLRHARAGGPDAEPVVDFLLDRFGEDPVVFGVPGTPELDARYGGRYRLDGDAALDVAVGVRNDWLMVGAGAQPTARLVRIDDDAFAPSGARGVRLDFDDTGDERTLTVTDGPVRLSGPRVGPLG